MKNALLIALALTSLSATAAPKFTKEQKLAAREACKAEGKTNNKEIKVCVKGKLTAGSAPATATATAPAAQ